MGSHKTILPASHHPATTPPDLISERPTTGVDTGLLLRISSSARAPLPAIMAIGGGGKMLGKMFRGGKMLRPTGDDDDIPDDSSEDDSSDDDDDDGDSNNNKKQAAVSAPVSATTNKKQSDANLSSDDDSDEDDDDDGEMEEDGKAPAKRAREESDDDDDDEEDEEEEEEEMENPPKSKKKRPNIASFIDDMAEDDDDDSDDDKGGTKSKKKDKDISREYMDKDAEAIIAQQERRRRLEGNWLDKLGGLTDNKERDDADVARIARELEERHSMDQRRKKVVIHRPRIQPGGPKTSLMAGTTGTSGCDVGGDSYDDDEEEMVGDIEVPQGSLVPSVSDPALWMFSCPTGKESELVYAIMNKCVAFAKRGQPLGITSVVVAQTKGKIYVESFSEPAVIEAVQGVRGVWVNSITKVPISDMTTVVSVVPKKVPVKKNDWVRMLRGHFRGDLALVHHVSESGLKCVIQCVPRLDLTLADLPPEEAKVRRRTVKPPQKFFNAQEIASMGRANLLRQRFPELDNVMCDYYDGSYYHDGYLLKEVTIGSAVRPCTGEDPPTLDELQRFRSNNKSSKKDKDDYDDGNDDENAGSVLAGSLLNELSELQGKTGLAGSSGPGDRGLRIGDTIEVIEGDLVGMQGKIMSLDDTTVKVRPNNDAALAELGGMDEVEFLLSQVRKHIAVGIHVKVTDGRYANETGVVVAVETIDGDADSDFDRTAVVLTDMTHKEISVRTSQLQESAEVASGQDTLAGYELHDLVVLSGGGSANEVGVIVRVGREEFTIINNHGIVREARPEELRGKRNKPSDRAVALDVQANQIRCGDSVTIVEGPHKGKTATIKRMSRAQLFLYSQFRSEHSGIFVVRSRSCVLTGGTKAARAAAERGAPMNSPYSTPSSQNGMGPMRGDRDESLMSKTVRIQAGQWKGYLGTVSHTTATHVQVELHSRLKKVMVVKDRVHVVGDKFGATGDNGDGAFGAPPMPYLSAATPMHGGATPMYGGATPMHGGATPMHDGYGGSTPSHSGISEDIWRPGGSLDRDSDFDDGTVAGSGWGTDSENTRAQNNPFATNNANKNGWVDTSDAGSTWTPNMTETESVIKHDPDTFDSRDDNNAIDSTIEGTGEEAAVWFMERVCVQLKMNSAQAVIKEINGSQAVVELEDKSIMSVRNGEVTMVAPQEHDLVLVTGGADVGVEGELVCIDGTDAILKESNENFKIVDFVHLAKIASG